MAHRMSQKPDQSHCHSLFLPERHSARPSHRSLLYTHFIWQLSVATSFGLFIVFT